MTTMAFGLGKPSPGQKRVQLARPDAVMKTARFGRSGNGDQISKLCMIHRKTSHEKETGVIGGLLIDGDQ